MQECPTGRVLQKYLWGCVLQECPRGDVVTVPQGLLSHLLQDFCCKSARWAKFVCYMYSIPAGPSLCATCILEYPLGHVLQKCACGTTGTLARVPTRLCVASSKHTHGAVHCKNACGSLCYKSVLGVVHCKSTCAIKVPVGLYVARVLAGRYFARVAMGHCFPKVPTRSCVCMAVCCKSVHRVKCCKNTPRIICCKSSCRVTHCNSAHRARSGMSAHRDVCCKKFP